VIVDCYFPVKEDKIVFSAANGNELWVMILEKAFAKVHGDYSRIIGGLSHETFRDLTGAPSYLSNIRDLENEPLWNILTEADDNKHIITAGIAPINME
jgi:hypothetical protein